MTARFLLIVGSLGGLLTLGAEEDVPHVQVRERVAPWGTVVERSRFYVKDGKEVEHGLQESFSPDGTVQSRYRYSHGKEDGVSEFFYDGIGAKQSELPYKDGLEDGLFRTWTPDGKLLFEGNCKNGERIDGWFDVRSTSSSGLYHRNGVSWKIVQWKGGKKVAGSTKVVETSWSTWTSGQLPDQKMFIRWSWPSYPVKSSYPYLEKMPTYQDVPYLIGCFEKKGDAYQESSDQLQALTRVQFGNPWLQSDPERIEATVKWRAWWEDIGKQRPGLQTNRGVRDAEAWDLARRGRDLPMPEEPQVIPEAYVLDVHFSSGDYEGVISETLTIKRNGKDAELIRSYSTRRNGLVTEERWQPFGVKDADRAVLAIGYLIDRPWLLNDEADIEKRYWAAEKKNPKGESMGKWCDDKLKGRESYGALYYPGAGFELRDASGKIWWNSDPDHWYGENPNRFNETHQPVPGTVFPFLTALYPESTRSDADGKPGWKAR